MSRVEEIVTYLESEYENKQNLEPTGRMELLLSHVEKSIEMYGPDKIVKAGLGSGEIVRYLAKNVKTVVVVEPSYENIKRFKEENKENPDIEKVYFINGYFETFPVDYFAADMLICIDYLDILSFGPVIDEFKRAIQFEGVLFLGSVVLNEEDIDGIYDELAREVNYLHNDYYLPSDLQTMLKLKEFRSLQGGVDSFKTNLKEKIEYFGKLYRDKKESANPEKFIEENQSALKEYYSYDEATGDIQEKYLTAIFKRNKPES